MFAAHTFFHLIEQVFTHAAIEDSVDSIVGIHEHAVPVGRAGLKLIVDHPAVMIDGQMAIGRHIIGAVFLMPQEGQQGCTDGFANEVHHKFIVVAILLVAHDAYING